MSLLAERISEHAKYFDKLISCIPAKLYLANTQDVLNSRFMHKKNAQEQQEVKENKKQARIDKVDPDAHQSTVEKQAEIGKTIVKKDSEPQEEEKPSAPSSASISELRQRLQAKIEELRNKRGQQNKVRKGRDQILEERRTDKIARQKAIEIRKSQLEKPATPPTPAKRPLESEENISYGKIKFESGQEAKKQRLDPKSALKKLEIEKQKLEQLKSKDEQKAKEIKQSKEWTRTLQLVAGDKLQDDEKKLKKAIKRREKKSEKSKKSWGERKDGVQKSIEKKQQKRTENIQKRKDQKKTKKKAKRGF